MEVTVDETIRKQVAELVQIANELVLRSRKKASDDSASKDLQAQALNILLKNKVVADHQKSAAANMLAKHDSTLRLLMKLATKAGDLYRKSQAVAPKAAGLGYPDDRPDSSQSNRRIAFIDSPSSSHLRKCDEFLLNRYRYRSN